MRQQALDQADIVGYNAVSTLLFDDPEAAGKTLAALRAEPNVIAAAIYDDARHGASRATSGEGSDRPRRCCPRDREHARLREFTRGPPRS